MQTIEEYQRYTRQLEGEVGKWHHAYDALIVERNALARELATWKKVADVLAQARILDEQQRRGKKMNEHEHIYDDCIGNPPFAEALKTLGWGSEWKLTEAQQRFFDENKGRVSNLPEDATEREKELAKIALFMANYAENLQGALNRVKAEYKAAMERTETTVQAQAMERYKRNDEFTKAFGAMVACYRAIDRNFGNEIRAHLEKNDRTQKEGQMRKLMEEMQRLSK